MTLRILVAILLGLAACWYWLAIVADALLVLSGAATQADEASGLFAIGMFALCAGGAVLVLKRRRA